MSNDLAIPDALDAPIDITTPADIEARMKRFEVVARIAKAMASAPLIPEHLRGEREGKTFRPYDPDAVFGNCFLVTNQALQWGMDPFAVAQATSNVRGKLCYEGKLVAAAIHRLLGVELRYEWFGREGTDEFGIRIWHPDDQSKMVQGTVGAWKTKDTSGSDNAAWRGANQRRQLKYRGDREWARMWAPGIILGVYTPDEMTDWAEDVRAERAKPLAGLAERLEARKAEGAQGAGGFDADRVHAELAAGASPPEESAPTGDPDPVEEAAPVDYGDDVLGRYVAAVTAATDRDTLEKAHRTHKAEVLTEPTHVEEAAKVVFHFCQLHLTGKVDREQRDGAIAGAVRTARETPEDE